ncbi:MULTISPECIES: peptidoglycan-associated lipoprotein Pal [unclassified Prosthecochloris]|uniref:peptidoglycan-associated lipoprotein Pal n=1 Tax=unclassified Prosthecochloris TaxID=2632826 RepID=UPI00223E4CC7|nr:MULTISPECIES: peptidoglycan-associated lipoprotein Pal [unclassified Prosthecochloris]UZJ38367.1 peptidoglycan-associated lipoprotein Pal [Prosthecochloris sp. SCSIO W1103]
MKFPKSLLNVFLILSMLFIIGCGSSCRDVVVKAPPLPLSAPMVELGDIFYAFDSSVLDMVSRSQLDENVQWMMENPNATIIIEGHCDERGTYEYNIALGEKRAENVKNYMVNAGVDPLRMQTVSYGEERPFDPGHDETAWAKNRRVHFVVQ